MGERPGQRVHERRQPDADWREEVPTVTITGRVSRHLQCDTQTSTGIAKITLKNDSAAVGENGSSWNSQKLLTGT